MKPDIFRERGNSHRVATPVRKVRSVWRWMSRCEWGVFGALAQCPWGSLDQLVLYSVWQRDKFRKRRTTYPFFLILFSRVAQEHQDYAWVGSSTVRIFSEENFSYFHFFFLRANCSGALFLGGCLLCDFLWLLGVIYGEDFWRKDDGIKGWQVGLKIETCQEIVAKKKLTEIFSPIWKRSCETFLWCTSGWWKWMEKAGGW